MKFLRAALLLALLAKPIRAQSGLYAPLVLQLPASTRMLAMGNMGVAGRDDDVLFANPAQLVVARGTSLSGERYSSTSSGLALSSASAFNNGGIAVGVSLVDYDSPFGTFPSNRETMRVAGPGTGLSVNAALGIAQVVKSIRVGGAVKYVEDDLPNVRASRGVVDVGLAKDMWRYYTVALAVQNIGAGTSMPCEIVVQSVDCSHSLSTGFRPGSTVVPMPIRTTLGIAGAAPAGEFDLVGTAGVSVLRKDFVIPAGGAEIGYSWLDGYNIALRAGARRPLTGEGPFTVGAGFRMDRLFIDYALETLSNSRVAHRVGLRVR
jgi:hypothetical protein